MHAQCTSRNNLHLWPLITLNSVYTEFSSWLLAWPLKICFLRPWGGYSLSIFHKVCFHVLKPNWAAKASTVANNTRLQNVERKGTYCSLLIIIELNFIKKEVLATLFDFTSFFNLSFYLLATTFYTMGILVKISLVFLAGATLYITNVSTVFIK